MNLQQIKNKIPHGGFGAIAQACNISKVTLSRFYNGKTKVSKDLKIKILNTTAQYLRDIKDKEKQAFKQFENI